MHACVAASPACRPPMACRAWASSAGLEPARAAQQGACSPSPYLSSKGAVSRRFPLCAAAWIQGESAAAALQKGPVGSVCAPAQRPPPLSCRLLRHPPRAGERRLDVFPVRGPRLDCGTAPWQLVVLWEPLRPGHGGSWARDPGDLKLAASPPLVSVSSTWTGRGGAPAPSHPRPLGGAGRTVGPRAERRPPAPLTLGSSGSHRSAVSATSGEEPCR